MIILCGRFLITLLDILSNPGEAFTFKLLIAVYSSLIVMLTSVVFLSKVRSVLRLRFKESSENNLAKLSANLFDDWLFELVWYERLW